MIVVDNIEPGQSPFYDPAAYNIDNSSGVVVLNDYHSNSTGPTGNRTVAYLAITATGSSGQSTPLDVTITTLSDSVGDDIPATDVDGLVTIQ